MKGEIQVTGDIYSAVWQAEIGDDLKASDREMAADLEAEAEALEWIECTAGDVGDEPW